MKGAQDAQATLVKLIISKDQMQALLSYDPALAGRVPVPSDAELEELLVSRKVAITDSVRARCAEYLALINAAVDPPEAAADDATPDSGADTAASPPPEVPAMYLVAEGRPSAEGVDGAFEWDPSFQPAKQPGEDEAVDYYSLNSILTVAADVVIGRITPPRAGSSGVNVYGEPVPPRRMQGTPLMLGSGVTIAPGTVDGVQTTAPGRVVIAQNRLNIDEVLEIRGDVDFKVGKINAQSNVHITGTILPNFVVKTAKNLTVDKAIENATVEVAQDLTVRGGIYGRPGRDQVSVGGTLTARHAESAHIRVVGNAIIAKELLNSFVHSLGRLQLDTGAILGGYAYARCGGKIHTIGSEIGVYTVIAIGAEAEVLIAARELGDQAAELRNKAAKVRSAVHPLLAQLKRLTPQQREQATELLAKADEIETAAEELERRRDQLAASTQPPTPARLEVTGLLHPGVRVRIGMRELQFKTSQKGPMIVEEREESGVVDVIARCPASGSVRVLPTIELTRELLAAGAADGGPADDASENHQ